MTTLAMTTFARRLAQSAYADSLDGEKIKNIIAQIKQYTIHSIENKSSCCWDPKFTNVGVSTDIEIPYIFCSTTYDDKGRQATKLRSDIFDELEREFNIDGFTICSINDLSYHNKIKTIYLKVM